MSGSRRVSLFVTCIVDQVWPAVGTSTVTLLRRLGCDVRFDPRQTCCGQPAFNTGYTRQAADLARRFIEVFEGDGDAVVSPSGSCTAMVHHYPELLADDPSWAERARALAARTFELSDYLVNVLGVEDVGAVYRGRLTWHDSCHGLRDLGIRDEPRRLLSKVKGAELVELSPAEVCCGFGGTFAVKYPEISVAITDAKIQAIQRTGADAVVALDASCLMQIGGRLSRLGSPVKVLHLAEVLAATDRSSP